jgi:hypothetical protein
MSIVFIPVHRGEILRRGHRIPKGVRDGGFRNRRKRDYIENADQSMGGGIAKDDGLKSSPGEERGELRGNLVQPDVFDPAGLSANLFWQRERLLGRGHCWEMVPI